MVIRVNGGVVYEGENNRSMERHGFGYEYEDGVLKRSGRWEKDELVEVKQRFVSGTEMIEYRKGAMSDVLSHKPIYVGGYQMDEKDGRIKRNGRGRVLNEQTGVCEYESEWENGVEKKGKQIRLRDGWYYQKTSNESIRLAVTGNQPRNSLPNPVVDVNRIPTPPLPNLVADDSQIPTPFPNPGMPTPPLPHLADPALFGQSMDCYPVDLQELTISSNSFNDRTITELRLSRFVHLKRVVIGDSCFKEVPLFKINKLNELSSIVIGRSCFAGEAMRRSESAPREATCFQIEDCQALKSLKIGDLSFCDYKNFVLVNLPSLQFIEIGVTCFKLAPSFSLIGRFR